MLTESFTEDLLANLILGVGLVAVACMRDFSKRDSHSDCALDRESGLKIKLQPYNPEDADTA